MFSFKNKDMKSYRFILDKKKDPGIPQNGRGALGLLIVPTPFRRG